MGQLREVLGKHVAVLAGIGQPLKVVYLVTLKYVFDMQELAVGIAQVHLQLVDEDTERPIDGHFQCVVDVLLHRVGEGEIANIAKRLVGTEQPVGA